MTQININNLSQEISDLQIEDTDRALPLHGLKRLKEPSVNLRLWIKEDGSWTLLTGDEAVWLTDWKGTFGHLILRSGDSPLVAACQLVEACNSFEGYMKAAVKQAVDTSVAVVRWNTLKTTFA